VEHTTVRISSMSGRRENLQRRVAEIASLLSRQQTLQEVLSRFPPDSDASAEEPPDAPPLRHVRVI